MKKTPKIGPWTAGQVVWGFAYAVATAAAGFLVAFTLVFQLASSVPAYRGPAYGFTVECVDRPDWRFCPEHDDYRRDLRPLTAPLRGNSGPRFHGERGV